MSVKLGAMAFDQNGRTALDMPALVESSKQDLKYVADEVTNMCQRCKIDSLDHVLPMKAKWIRKRSRP